MPTTNAIGEGAPWCERCQTWHAWRHQESDFRVFESDLRDCCKTAAKFGGSHYHCARCGEQSSMLGHYRGVHWEVVDGVTKTIEVEGHMCCPGDCELEETKVQ